MNSEALEELTNVETSEEEHEGDSADHSRTYDDDIRAAIPGYDLLHETVAALLQNELGENARVLAAGVGTGEEILRLAPGNPGWRFTGEDPSAAMLAVAREKVAAEGVSDRVELIEGLVQDLPAAEPYDAATLILVQHFLPDDGAKLELLRAIAERLKPNAPLLVANMHGDLTVPATQRLYQAWKQRQIARGMSAEDAEGMFTGLPTVVHFVPEARIRALLWEAGFMEIEPVFKAFVIGAWLARKGADS
jgi:tRNA (cmo5U34)-methyltransferase